MKTKTTGKALQKTRIAGKATPPLVTIITVVKNGAKQLPRTIACIAEQSYPRIEFIVIDGLSSDGTLDLVRASRRVSAFLCEPDSGIAEAWNKGLRMAHGDLIGLLNAGDEYAPDTVEKAVEAYQDGGVGRLYYCDCLIVDRGEVVRAVKGAFSAGKLHRGLGFAHPGCFVPKEVYQRNGLYLTKYRIAMDIEFLLRCHANGVPFARFMGNVYMAAGGVSDKRYRTAFKEYKRILRKSGVPHDRLRLLLFSSLWPVVRPWFRRRSVRRILRLCKHLSIHAMNLLHNHLPFFAVRRAMLRSIGFRMDSGSCIHPPLRFYVPGNVHIGRNSVVNRDCILDNRGGIEIGSNVSIAHGCRIYTAGHNVQSPYFEMTISPVAIGDFVCLFASSMVMPGVRIGKGAVVLPGAVVTRDVAEFDIVGGVPAKPTSKRTRRLAYRLDYRFWKAL